MQRRQSWGCTQPIPRLAVFAKQWERYVLFVCDPFSFREMQGTSEYSKFVDFS